VKKQKTISAHNVSSDPLLPIAANSERRRRISDLRPQCAFFMLSMVIGSLLRFRIDQFWNAEKTFVNIFDPIVNTQLHQSDPDISDLYQ
jgi:hypothetical protein